MIDLKTCEWLSEHADAPVRYRVARELLGDEKAARLAEPLLLENLFVKRWFDNIKPSLPTHGSFDYCLENMLPVALNLGLNGGIPEVRDALECYSAEFADASLGEPRRKDFIYFNSVLNANLLSAAGIGGEAVLKWLSGSLDEIYNFTSRGLYDIYISESERKKLTGVPPNWTDNPFIKPELLAEHGFGYPLIYDIIGLHSLYKLNDAKTNAKVNSVIEYISTDDFHEKISEGYGILIMGKYGSGNMKYNGMGWDPKYPGWFDAAEYMENTKPSKLLFFAGYISKYPVAIKTKWFENLICCLERYRTDIGTYIFPKEWFPEKTGYAVGGFHMSLGESRRKKNWIEIESTFYVQLLKQNIK